MARQALGKGLKALINTDEPQESEVREVAVGAITPNPYQPRREFDPIKLEELAGSIKEHGIIQPLVVKAEAADRYVLIAGERRFRAAQMAGLAAVPVIIRELDRDQMIQWALVENLQREDLNPIEEALAYRRLAEEFHSTQEEIAQVVGKSRPAVANSLRLLTLPQEIQDAVSRGTLSMGHARCLIGLPDGAMRQVFQRISDAGLNVRQTEEICERLKVAAQNLPKEDRPKSPTKNPYLLAAEEELRRYLGTKVQIESQKNGKGKIQIDFFSNDELNRLLELLSNR